MATDGEKGIPLWRGTPVVQPTRGRDTAFMERAHTRVRARPAPGAVLQVVLTAVDIELDLEDSAGSTGVSGGPDGQPPARSAPRHHRTSSDPPPDAGAGPGWLGAALQGWLLRALCNVSVQIKHLSLGWYRGGPCLARCAFQSLELASDAALTQRHASPEAWLGKRVTLVNLSLAALDPGSGALAPVLVLPQCSLALVSPVFAYLEASGLGWPMRCLRVWVCMRAWAGGDWSVVERLPCPAHPTPWAGGPVHPGLG